MRELLVGELVRESSDFFFYSMPQSVITKIRILEFFF